MPENKVLFIIAHTGYQPVEYGVPKKIIEGAGYRVVTASDKKGNAIAKDGSTTPVDILLDDVELRDYDAIIFVGGPGALEHLDTELSYELLRKAFNEEKIIGAICIAPRILAKAGILTNIEATGWNEDEQLPIIFKEQNVRYVPAPVVIDRHIVTAEGPKAADSFGQELVRELKNKNQKSAA